MPPTQALQALKDLAQTKETPELFAALYELEKIPAADMTNEQKMIRAAISDTITERHNISDTVGHLYTALEITYLEALEIAYTSTQD